MTGYPSEEYARDPDLCRLAIDENGRLLLAYHAGENTKTPPPDVDHDFGRRDLLEPAAADARA